MPERNLLPPRKIYLKFLRFFVAQNRKYIDDYIVKAFPIRTTHKTFLREMNDNLIVRHLRNTCHNDVFQVHLGFPFSLATLKLKSLTKRGSSFEFYVKGEPLRIIQRELLKKWLSLSPREFEWKEIATKKKFKDIVFKKIKEYRGLVYVDPYKFVGDSFIGLDFFNAFNKFLGVENSVLFSDSYKHLRFAFKAYPRDINTIKKFYEEYKLLLIPDLMDDHWEKTLNIIKALINIDGVMLIPGRSLAVSVYNQRVSVYHYNAPDKWLKDQNIEDFIDDCINTFIEKPALQRLNPFSGSENIFYINPFGSESDRTLDCDFVIRVCDLLYKRNKKVDITIIGGLRRKIKHQKWLDYFRTQVSEYKFNYKIKYFCNLSCLVDDMRKNECGAVLTPDTSIAHLTNYLNLPNLTICPTANFNRESIQSMVSVAPLGFCRYFKSQFPVLIESYRNTSGAYLHNIVDALEFQVKPYSEKKRILSTQALSKVKLDDDYRSYYWASKNIDPSFLWVREIFNAPYFTEKLDKNYEKLNYLKKVAVRLSPLYKIINF